MDEINVTIQGMTCRGCEVRIKQALEALPNVHRATVTYEAGEALVEAESGRVQEAELVAAVRRVGAYHLTVRGSATMTKQELRPQGEGFSMWSVLAAVGIGIAGSWC